MVCWSFKLVKVKIKIFNIISVENMSDPSPSQAIFTVVVVSTLIFVFFRFCIGDDSVQESDHLRRILTHQGKTVQRSWPWNTF